jgi:predicted nucleic acid-binding OB-fold protein
MEQREKPAKDVAKKINEEDLKDKSKEELLTIISDLRKENLSNAIIS